MIQFWQLIHTKVSWYDHDADILYSMLSPCHNVIMRLETLLGWKFYIGHIKNLDTAKNNFCKFNQADESTKSVEKFEWWAKMELKKCEMSLGDSGTLWSMSFHFVGRKKWPCYVKGQKGNSCSKSIDKYFFWYWTCWKTATYGVGQWRNEKQPFQIELYCIMENKRGFLRTLFMAMWKGLLCSRMN